MSAKDVSVSILVLATIGAVLLVAYSAYVAVKTQRAILTSLRKQYNRDVVRGAMNLDFENWWLLYLPHPISLKVLGGGM